MHIHPRECDIPNLPRLEVFALRLHAISFNKHYGTYLSVAICGSHVGRENNRVEQMLLELASSAVIF
jgi:hypothetical protein